MAKGKKNAELSLEERLEAALVPNWEHPYKVPENWCWTTLHNLASVKGGKRVPKGQALSDEKTDHPYIRVTDFQNNGVNVSGLKYIDDSVFLTIKNYTISSEDVYISIAGSIGKVGIIPAFLDGANLTENAAKITNINGIAQKYLLWYLNSEFAQQQIKESTISTTQSKLALFRIESFLTPLPPFAEQQRIVDRIESLFAKLDEAKEKAQAVVDGFEDRKAAILHKAFTGELTAEWRKDLNMADWECVKLGKYLKPMETRRPVGDRFLYIDIDSIDNKKQEVRAPKDTLVKDAPSRASRAVHHGDVLFSMVRPYLKNIALIDESLQECIASTGFYVCTPKNGLDSKYLYYLLCSKDAIDYLMQFMKGDNSPSIRKDDLLNMEIMLPSNPEQIQIIQILDDVLEHEQHAKESTEQVIDQIDTMKKSILARAFRGELGTNDPNDESAIELLKKVLQEENPEPKQTRRITIPKDLASDLKTELEKKIVKLYFQKETSALPISEIMGVSSKKFDVLESIRSLEQRQIISKQEDGNYKLMR